MDRFLEHYADSGISRFHMPGHKGNFPPLLREGLARLDITEVTGADYLFRSAGILRELEERVSAFYGTFGTAISTGGSTLCIQTMLAASFRQGDRILAARNAHTAFVNACALLGLEPVWICPEAPAGAGIGGALTSVQVVDALEENEGIRGVYLTSPDYLGGLTDIAAIADVCHARGILLVVDNAHGAALRLADPDRHPMTLGADICCDSAHKTLPVLTGGAFLHYSSCFSAEQIKKAMALFGSTSPSYLVMDSISLCMDWLEREGKAAYRGTADRILRLKELCREKRIPLPGGPAEPFRLCIGTGALGMTDAEAMDFFHRHQIEPEFVGGGYTVLMASPFQREQDWQRLETAVLRLDGTARPALSEPVASCVYRLPETVMTPREAVFAQSETVPLEQASGRIAAQTVITCPPGIPVLVPGEKITSQTEIILKNSGNLTVKVVK